MFVDGQWFRVPAGAGGLAVSMIGVLEGSIEIADASCRTITTMPVDTQEGIVRIDATGAYLDDLQGSDQATYDGLPSEQLESMDECIGRVQPGGPDVASGAPTILLVGGPSFDVMRIAADGSGLTRLTTTPESEQILSVSDAGDRIVFDVLTDDGADVHELRDGTETTLVKEAWGSAVSPDGESVAYLQGGRIYEDGQVLIREADGTDAVIAEHASRVTWSPDGRRLALEVTAPTAVYHSELWVVRRDGTGKQRLTAAGEYGRDPHWSPDATRIAFTVDPVDVETSDGSAEPSSLSADGPPAIRIFDVPGPAGKGSLPGRLLGPAPSGGWAATDWSDAGLLVDHYASGDDPGASVGVVDVASGALTDLSRPTHYGSDVGGRWSRDDSMILFERDGDGQFADLWVMGADGRDSHAVTTGTTEAIWDGRAER